MKNTLIKIQNFFLALAMVVRHPVKAPELMLARRNEEELAADIEAINRERIRTLYGQEQEPADPELKKKEYRKINESYEKRLIFQVGFGAGLFSELDSMMEHMLFCFENHIRFEIYADDANFSKAGGMGWEELFEPFCPINHDKLNHIANYRPTDYKSTMRHHRLWYKGYFLPKILKRRTGADYLTQDIWCMCINNDFKYHPVDFPLFGMKGTATSQFSKFGEIAICPKPDVRKEMDALISKLHMPEHFVSMQIRGGDKCLEYKELKDAASYVEKVEALGLSGQPLFIFTDDYTNVTKIRELRPEWELYTLTGEEERGYYNEAFNRQDWEFRRKNLIKLLAIVELCKKADYHIGPNQSCVDLYLRSVKGLERYIVL